MFRNSLIVIVIPRSLPAQWTFAAGRVETLKTSIVGRTGLSLGRAYPQPYERLGSYFIGPALGLSC